MSVLDEAPGAVPVRRDLPALAAGLVTVTAWGSAFVGIRAAGHALSPGSIALGRLLVARPLQRRPERRGAPGRRRDGGDAREHRPDPGLVGVRLARRRR